MTAGVILGIEAAMAILDAVQKLNAERTAEAQEALMVSMARINAFLDFVAIEVEKRRSHP